METREASTQRWRFGIFEVDAQSLELRRNGTRVKLREQSFRILVLLLERAGDTVTREELRQRLWPSDTWVDFDHSLNTAVMKLRDALGDSADKPLYIETIPKRGYRFVAPASVRRSAPSALAGPGAGNAGPGSGLNPVLSAGDGTVEAYQPSRNGIGPPASRVPIAVGPGLAGAWTSKRFRWLQVFSIAISLAAVGAGLFWFFHRRLTTNQPRAEQRVTSNSPEAPIRSAVVSPDGKYLAYSDPTGLYLRHVATGEIRRWAVPKDFIAHANSWFPDGTHLLVTRFEGPMQTPSLWKLSSLEGSPRKLMDNAGPGAVSPDGSRIAFLIVPDWGRELWVRGSDLWVMHADGSDPHKIASREAGQPASRDNEIVSFAWSPNGQRIAYIERHVAPTPYPVDDVFFSLRTRDANGGDLQVILDDKRLRPALAWAPDGRILVSYQQDATSDRSDEGVRSIRVDQQTGRASGRLQVLTIGSGSIGSSIGWMSLSSDGMRLVLSRNNIQAQSFIAEFEADTRRWKTPRLLTLDANENAAEAWLPDNRTVVFVSNRNGRWALFKQAMDETTAEVLVEQPCIGLPRLSADGLQMMYQLRTCPGNFSAPVSLMRLPIAGGPPQLSVREAGIMNYQCARLPSTLCIFSQMQGSDHVYVSFDPQHGRGHELLRIKGSIQNWTLSPDGRTLAVFPGDHRIRFFSVENGVAHEGNAVTLNDWWIHNGDWNADGKGVLVPSVSPTGTHVILEVDRAGKASIVLEGAANTTFAWMVPSPDGRHGILAAEVPGDNNVWMVDTF